MPLTIPVSQTGLEASIQAAMRKAGKNIRLNLGDKKNIDSLTQPLGRLTGKADEFTKSMEAANARVLAFGASVGVIAGITKGFKELIKTTIEVEKSLTNINTILRQSEGQLDGFKNTLFEVARNTGQTFDQVAEAALDLSRQGLKAEEVTKRLNDALILSRLSGLSATDSVSGLTAAINTFSKAGITSEQVLNKISAASASAAVSDRDLIEGLKRSGSVASTTGVKFDELIGIIGALQERTARGGSVIGNSLKTIFTRIQSVDRLESLQNLGVQVTDLEGKVLSSSKIIENLAPVFAKLDQGSRINLADNLVGKFQIAPFLSLLEDYNQKVVRSNEIAQVSFGATNEAYERNILLNGTLAAMLNKATVSLKELGNQLGEIGVTDNFKKVLGYVDTFLSGLNKLFDGDGIGSDLAKGIVKGIGGVLSGPGLLLIGAIILKLSANFAKFGVQSLGAFFGINKAAKEQAILQGQITSSLLNDSDIRERILTIEGQSISVARKRRKQTEAITIAINAQLRAMKKMQSIAAAITPGVAAGTSRVRRSAGGFLPIGAEQADISRGVGGAPASAKPVVIPNFAFGGGQRGTMVANSSEYIVPNYAGGGDAIFNQNMASSMGLPANARKVRAASGYIPNFAPLTIAEILRKPGNYIKGDGAFKSQKASDAYNNSSSKEKSEIDNIRNKGRLKAATTLNIDGSRYGVASLFQEKKSEDSFTNISQLKDPLALKLKDRGVQEVKFNDIQIRPLENVEKNLKKGFNESENRNRLAELFNKPLMTYAESIIGKVFGNDEFKAIKGKIKESRNGAHLFSSAVEGGIFESAMQLGTKGARGIKDFDSYKDDQAPFDFEEGSFAQDPFIKAFGFNKPNGNLKKADAKRTASNEAVRTIISKAFRGDTEYIKGQARKQGLLGQSKKKAASGYIPNFADPVQDAISRERAAGVPINQIRINQSGKLRNTQNPSGLAVTNTRDEPTGAIPNFAGGSSNNQLAQSTEKLTKVNRDYLGIIFGVQAGFAALSAATGDSTEGIGKWTSLLSDAGSTVTSFVFAGQGLSQLGDTAKNASGELVGIKGGLGKFAKGLGIVGVAFGVGKGIYDLANAAINDHAGAAKRVSTALDKLSLVSDELTRNFKLLSKERQYEITQQAESILGRRGVSGPIDIFADTARTLNAEFAAANQKPNFLIDEKTDEVRRYQERTFEGSEEDQARLKASFIDVIKSLRAMDVSINEVDGILDNFGTELSAEDLTDFKRIAQDKVDKVNQALENYQKYLKGLTLQDFEALKGPTIAFSASNPRNPALASAALAQSVAKAAFDKSSAGVPVIEAKTLLDKRNKEVTEKDLADKNKVTRIKGEGFKAQLSQAVKLAQLKLDALSADEKSLQSAKILGNLTDKQVRALEQVVALGKINKGVAKASLDAVEKEISANKELTAGTDQIGQIQKAIGELVKEGNVDQEKAVGVIRKILSLNKQNNVGLEETVANIVATLTNQQEYAEKQKASNTLIHEGAEGLYDQVDAIKEANRVAKNLAETLKFEGAFRFQDQLNDLDFEKVKLELEISSGRLTPTQEETNRQRIKELNAQSIDVNAQKSRDALFQEAKAFIPEGVDPNEMSFFDQDLKSATSLDDLYKRLETVSTTIAGEDGKKEIEEFIAATKRQAETLEQQISADKRKSNADLEAASASKAALTAADTLIRSLEKAGAPSSVIAKAKRDRDTLADERYKDIPGQRDQLSDLDRGYKQIISEDTRFDERFTAEQLKKNLIDGSFQFLQNMDQAFQNAITGADSLGDALLKIAGDFLKQITSAFSQKYVADTFGKIFGGDDKPDKTAASGGYIAGGSGNKDDIPAMLMGGEFVMKKKAVQKYGTGFMNSLNNGSIQGYASGGIVANQKRDKEGMFTTPGVGGAGNITGMRDLLSFATQSPAAMNRDSLFSSGSASGAFLDPESARLSMFGRRNNNQFSKVQDAKRQAFDLFVSQSNAEAEATRVGKERKDQFKKDLISAGVSSLVGFGASALGSKLNVEGGQFQGIGKALSIGAGGIGNVAGALASNGGQAYFGGFGAGAQQYGAKAIEEVKQLFRGGKSTSSSPETNTLGIASANINESGLDYVSKGGKSFGVNAYDEKLSDELGDLFETAGSSILPVLPNRAAGGTIPSAAGVDTVPTMLSGGEFVMNAAATQRIGTGNLQSLNSGSSVGGDNKDLISKLDQLITATEKSGSGEINITINKDGSENTANSQDTSRSEQEFSQKIKTAVKQVIANEQRLGGQLRA